MEAVGSVSGSNEEEFENSGSLIQTFTGYSRVILGVAFVLMPIDLKGHLVLWIEECLRSSSRFVGLTHCVDEILNCLFFSPSQGRRN